jgi:hypothetical protein
LLEQEMRLTAETEMVQIWMLLSIADGYEMIGETKRALSLLDQWRVVRDKLGIGGGVIRSSIASAPGFFPSRQLR